MRDMSSHRFRIVNVFTRSGVRLTGNPLCVFEQGAEFDHATMQALARQFNLSETTFILPSARAAARVRIFTPSYEMPFAGHPTLGTAHVLRALGLGGDALELEMQAGVIPVEAVGDRWTLTAPEATWREVDAPRATLARALGLAERDIGERPLWLKSGREQLVVPLTSPEAVRRAAPAGSAAMAAIRGEDGDAMVYVFAPSGPGQVTARFFFADGPAMLEDPATGSATANFGGWCLAMNRPLPVALEISQGDLAGRPSTLHLDVGPDKRVRVSGEVIAVGAGSLTL
jgi:PhzF family phenazine biosynthesis protein